MNFVRTRSDIRKLIKAVNALSKQSYQDFVTHLFRGFEQDISQSGKKNNHFLKYEDDEKSKTTVKLTQRDIFKTIFRLARPAFFRFRCYQLIKMKLQYYIVVNVVIHISKTKGVGEMTNKTNKIKKKGAF